MLSYRSVFSCINNIEIPFELNPPLCWSEKLNFRKFLTEGQTDEFLRVLAEKVFLRVGYNIGSLYKVAVIAKGSTRHKYKEPQI